MRAQYAILILFALSWCVLQQRLAAAVHSPEQKVHHCQRECHADEPSRTCEYRFKVEWYYTMSKACYDCPYNLTDCYRPDCVPADGVEKPIIVINRSLPGPSIQVWDTKYRIKQYQTVYRVIDILYTAARYCNIVVRYGNIVLNVQYSKYSNSSALPYTLSTRRCRPVATL